MVEELRISAERSVYVGSHNFPSEIRMSPKAFKMFENSLLLNRKILTAKAGMFSRPSAPSTLN